MLMERSSPTWSRISLPVASVREVRLRFILLFSMSLSGAVMRIAVEPNAMHRLVSRLGDTHSHKNRRSCRSALYEQQHMASSTVEGLLNAEAKHDRFSSTGTCFAPRARAPSQNSAPFAIIRQHLHADTWTVAGCLAQEAIPVVLTVPRPVCLEKL